LDLETSACLASGLASRVAVNGGAASQLQHRPAGRAEYLFTAPMSDHEVALGYILEALVNAEHGVVQSLQEIDAIGHRVLHGGDAFAEPVLISGVVEAAIERFSELGPLHNPANLLGIRACKHRLPGVPQVAVFDTAFHQTLAPADYTYGLPLELCEEYKIRRYGFHGTSHRYVSREAAKFLQANRGLAPENLRLLTCHLGNGSSVDAIHGGKAVRTSMGFTPLAGLVMGTRCGDIDPAVIPFLINHLHLSAQELDDLMNKQSGLLGISGISSDMRDIHQAAAAGNARAQLAQDMFCVRLKEYIGAYATAMNGLDALVFTAGIGENDPIIRAQTMHGMEFLGLHLDPAKNEDASLRGRPADISTEDSPARILVIPTNEELMIARDTASLTAH
jgi:acetate kinase